MSPMYNVASMFNMGCSTWGVISLGNVVSMYNVGCSTWGVQHGGVQHGVFNMGCSTWGVISLGNAVSMYHVVSKYNMGCSMEMEMEI
jgi:hypothetical protein